MDQETPINAMSISKSPEIAAPYEFFSPSQVFFGSLLCNPFCGALMLAHNRQQIGLRFSVAPFLVVTVVLATATFVSSAFRPSDENLLLTAVVAAHICLTIFMGALTQFSSSKIEHKILPMSRRAAGKKWIVAAFCAAAFWGASGAAYTALFAPTWTKTAITKELTLQHSERMSLDVVMSIGMVLDESGRVSFVLKSES